jgi:hypothetical protein
MVRLGRYTVSCIHAPVIHPSGPSQALRRWMISYTNSSAYTYMHVADGSKGTQTSVRVTYTTGPSEITNKDGPVYTSMISDTAVFTSFVEERKTNHTLESNAVDGVPAPQRETANPSSDDRRRQGSRPPVRASYCLGGFQNESKSARSGGQKWTKGCASGPVQTCAFHMGPTIPYYVRIRAEQDDDHDA